MIHTTDGGKSWSQVMPAPEPHKDIQFIQRQYGFSLAAASNPNALLVTDDGGQSWSVVHAFPANLNVVHFSFTNEKQGWVYATERVKHKGVELPEIAVYQTTDGGKTWSRAGKLPQHGVSAIGGDWIHFFNSKDGLVQLTDFPNITFSVTQDGSRHWSKQSLSLPEPPGSQDKISFLSPRDGFIFQHTGKKTIKIYHTTDGTAWKSIDAWQLNFGTSSLFEMVDAQMISDTTGYVLTRGSAENRYQLWMTSDGGRTWAARPFPKNMDFRTHHASMDFVNAKTGWIENEQGLLKTSDGGQTWTWIN